MNAVAAIAAFSVAALVLAGLLRTRVGDRLVATPSGERWHERATPVFGGVGIFLGLVAGVGAAVVLGADASSELAGILGGCAVLFVAGLVDDLFTLPPIAKLAAQFAAAGIVLASGLTVEIVGSNLLATVLGVVWLVGITNAFNLLDNMDGLAASLAAVACAVFAVDAISRDSGELAVVVALALGGACVGFLPFNLQTRPQGRRLHGRLRQPGDRLRARLARARLQLDDGRSDADGHRAAAAGARDPDPRHDPRDGPTHPRAASGHARRHRPLVAPARLLRPLRAAGCGGADAAGGAARRDRARVQHAFQREGDRGRRARLVRRARPVRELPRRPRGALAPRRSRAAAVALARALLAAAPARRGARRLRDASAPRSSSRTCSSSTATATTWSARSSSRRCRCCSASGTSSSSCSGSTGASGGSRRRATWSRLARRRLLSARSRSRSSRRPGLSSDFPLEIFVVDVAPLHACSSPGRGSRCAWPPTCAPHRAGSGERTLIVGAGRSGRRLARELRETPGTRVVGFVDDNPSVRRRRVLGVKVLGAPRRGRELIAAAPGRTRSS